MCFHFHCDLFICSVSNFHSSQHSTEAFKRSFVHSCITKSCPYLDFNSLPVSPPQKKKNPKPSYRTLNFKSLIKDLVIYIRQDKATALVLQTKNLDRETLFIYLCQHSWNSKPYLLCMQSYQYERAYTTSSLLLQIKSSYLCHLFCFRILSAVAGKN